jgi:hypothetical protein
MKRFLMLVGVAVVAGAMYVAAAPGSRQATAPTTRQYAALKKQIGILNKKLKVLTKDETNVKKLAVDVGGFVVECFLSTNAGAAGVTQFGDASSSTYGFYYAAAAGAPQTFRTGLDLDTSATPQGYLQAVDPTCVTGSTGAASKLAGTAHLPLLRERSH